jgi:hypothetical protein
VQAILRHLGLHRRYLSDLVPAGLRVFAVKGLTALPAGRWLERDSLLDPVGRDQVALLAGVARLPAPLATRCRLGRPAFDLRRVAGGRAGRVSGVLVEALPQCIDLLLKGLQPLLILLDEVQDRHLGGRRYLAPVVNRNRRNRQHTNISPPWEARAHSGFERLQPPNKAERG